MAETKTFPYEMTELISKEEEELQALLRREVRRMEFEMKCRMLRQRCKGAMCGSKTKMKNQTAFGLYSVTTGN